MRKELELLRLKMHEIGADAYIIPTQDFHSSEYVGDYFKCREYVSGFTGSAGELLVLDDFAGLWTDGRYFLQAGMQLEGTGITLMKKGEIDVPGMVEFLGKYKNNRANSNKNTVFTVAFDGRCISPSFYADLKRALGKGTHYITNIDLVDQIWTNRPGISSNPIWELNMRYTGENRLERMNRVRAKMKEVGADVHILSCLDDICWLYLIRGSDVDYNPVPLCYTVIYEDHADLYLCIEQVKPELKENLLKDGVTLKPYNRIYDDLASLNTGIVLYDNESINVSMLEALGDLPSIITDNPTSNYKGVKTTSEAENEKKAHIKDGVALTKLLIYLKKEMRESSEFKEGLITELTLADKLDNYRKEEEDYLYQSFAPIIASGEHGAIVHYDPTPETDIPIRDHTFLLMDTGGQYMQGTTDVTRTVSIGDITPKMKFHYTLVLKGHLALVNAVFHEGAYGQSLDMLARGPLNQHGLDYNHGTGHGVGYLLNVHEGPQSIRYKIGDVKPSVMKVGMITSDEPGVYITGKYGIRTENLMLCVEKKNTEFGRFLGFEFLTLAPYDSDCILAELLTEDELTTLNQYHEKVYQTLKGALSDKYADYLYEMTRPL